MPSPPYRLQRLYDAIRRVEEAAERVAEHYDENRRINVETFDGDVHTLLLAVISLLEAHKVLRRRGRPADTERDAHG